MNSDNLKFISNNVKGMQISEKRIKIFEYLKVTYLPTDSFFFRKHMALLMTKKGGAMSLMTICIFRTQKLICAV